MTKNLLLLALVCMVVRGQINKSCALDMNCFNGPVPCTGNQCICDPLVYKCKLALRQPCSETQDYCNTNTICFNRQCVSYEGKYCEAAFDCIFGLNCINRVCTSQNNQPLPQPNGNPCAPGSFFNGIFCAACGQNCADCSPTGVCNVCAPGFHLYNGACYNCPPNCQSCITGGACLECSPGYILSNNHCIPQSNVCPNNCLSCTYNGICLACQQGYGLVNGVCMLQMPQTNRCPENCLTCNRNGMCEYCTPGSTLINGQCLLQSTQCPNNCKSCTPNGICLFCDQGYTLTEGNCIPQLSACPPNCYLCMSNGNCVLCDNGYLPENGRCASLTPKCPENCLQCSDPRFCTICVPGFTLYNGQCLLQASQICPENCIDCGLDRICTACASGYRVNNGVCVAQIAQCPPNCQACDVLGSCLLCAPDTKLLNGVCIPQSCPSCCPGCSFDEQGNIKCENCVRNTVYKNGQCVTCGAGIYGCASCRDCACVQCVTGFYLSTEGTCIECASVILNCATCNGPDACTSCIPLYSLETDTGQCVMYSPVPYNERLTKECEEGKYVTEDGRCMDCYYTCSKCTGAGTTQCTKCKENAILFGDAGKDTGTCKCKNGFKADRLTKKCEPVKE